MVSLCSQYPQFGNHRTEYRLAHNEFCVNRSFAQICRRWQSSESGGVALRKVITTVCQKVKKPLIVDYGNGIGLASLQIARGYPTATVVGCRLNRDFSIKQALGFDKIVVGKATVGSRLVEWEGDVAEDRLLDTVKNGSVDLLIEHWGCVSYSASDDAAIRAMDLLKPGGKMYYYGSAVGGNRLHRLAEKGLCYVAPLPEPERGDVNQFVILTKLKSRMSSAERHLRAVCRLEGTPV